MTKILHQELRRNRRYYYKGRTAEGDTIYGELYGFSRTDALLQLRQQEVNVRQLKRRCFWHYWLESSITAADITLLLRQLATLTTAGLPLLQSLLLIRQSASKIKLVRLTQQLAENIQAGNNLSESLQQQQCFDLLSRSLISAGEQSGTLDHMLTRIAAHREKSALLQKKVRKVLLYPLAVLLIASVVTAILLLYAVPQFSLLYSSMGAELPAFTGFVLQLSALLQHNGLALLAASGLCCMAFRFLYKRQTLLRRLADKLLLIIPIVRKNILARFCRILATFSSAAIPLDTALSAAVSVSDNRCYQSAVLAVQEQINAGQSLYSALSRQTLFPPVLLRFVATGEASGTLDSMLQKLAILYEQETDDLTEGLTSLLEPVIMATLGVIVGALIIALYLPIFRMGSLIG